MIDSTPARSTSARSTPARSSTVTLIPATQLLTQQIHAALPQTQCTRCGYPDCAAYAHAVATHGAAINQCPPGGNEGVRRLAAITGQPALPLNPTHGLEGPRSVAVIDEAWCIGCTLCLPACPADAILGSNKVMHTVIESHCTGCELCIAVCPVDCISLENVTSERVGWNAWSQADADAALNRYGFHRARFQAHPTETADMSDNAETATLAVATTSQVNALDDAKERKRSLIDAAILRARASRSE